jgi:hypothetical protein
VCTEHSFLISGTSALGGLGEDLSFLICGEVLAGLGLGPDAGVH